MREKFRGWRGGGLLVQISKKKKSENAFAVFWHAELSVQNPSKNRANIFLFFPNDK